MKNLKIKHKLFLFSGIFISVLIFTCCISLYLMSNINQGSTIISRNWLPSVIIAEELNTATSDFRIFEASHVISQDRETMQKHEQTLLQIADEIEDLFDQYYLNMITNHIDLDYINSAYELWQKYLDIHDEMIAFSKENDTQSAMKIMESTSEQVFEEVSLLFLELVQFNKNGSDLASNNGDDIYKNAILILFLVMVIFVTCAIVLSYIIIFSISKPVLEIEEVARNILKGNLSVDINYNSKDELGDLSTSMRKLCRMLQGLNDDLSQLLGGLSAGDFTVKSQNELIYQGELAPLLTLTNNISKKLTDFVNDTKKLTTKSQKDGLTQLFNSGYFHEHIEQKSKITKNGCLILIDIDFFKQVNDNYGHQRGDEVLKRVAQTLKNNFRSEDIIGRLGGDEFIIFIDAYISKPDIEQRCRLILEILSNDEIKLPITLSIGGFFFSKETNYQDLYKRADEVLYKVKDLGRNGFMFDEDI